MRCGLGFGCLRLCMSFGAVVPRHDLSNRSIANAYRRAIKKISWRPNPLAQAKRPGDDDISIHGESDETDPDQVQDQAGHGRQERRADRGGVCRIEGCRPDGVRYLTLRLEDDTFIHFVETAADDGTSALPKLAAFQAFQSGIRERCAEPPLVQWCDHRRQLPDAGRDLIAGRQNDIDRPRRRPPSISSSLLVAMRPKLHRYCARMVGSVIDGEDVLQDALIKAVEAFAVRRSDRAIPKAGCSGSRTIPRWISCAAAPAGGAAIGRGGGHDCRPAR